MRWEKVSRCRCAGTGIKPSASCCSRKRCGGERCREVRITELNASERFRQARWAMMSLLSHCHGEDWGNSERRDELVQALPSRDRRRRSQNEGWNPTKKMMQKWRSKIIGSYFLNITKLHKISETTKQIHKNLHIYNHPTVFMSLNYH